MAGFETAIHNEKPWEKKLIGFTLEHDNLMKGITWCGGALQ